MLYLHENTYPYPGMMDEYVRVMETDLLPGLSRHMTVLGVFRVAFRHRETFFLSELPHGVETLEGLSTFVMNERDGLAWHREGFRYRDEWFDSLLEGLPFSPTGATIEQRQKQGDFTGNTLYYRLVHNVLPGRTDEFLESFEKELVPMVEGVGMKLAGCYSWFGACGESGEIISFWSLKNWAHWGQIREAQIKRPEFRRWMEKLSVLCAGWSCKFLIPTPYSMLH
ncbi:MAG: NIPSNAP family protein [Dehalococcoidia bacterium]